MKKMLLSFFAAFVAIASGAAPGWTGEGRTARTATQNMVKQLDGKGGTLHSSIWGILAVNMKGDTLAALNSYKLMVPASNMKLVTTAAALTHFGGNYKFRTSFETDGQIADSTLVGDLYIVGGGDPTIGNIFSYMPSENHTFGKWKEVLAKKGIKRIQGDIVGDGRHFQHIDHHTDWSSEDLECKDGVLPSGLTWRGTPQDSLPDGPLAAAWYFRKWLENDGSIKVSGDVREISSVTDTSIVHIPDSLMVLGTVESPPLRSIISTANRWSDNFIAETLLRELGLSIMQKDDYTSSISALRKALSPLGMSRSSWGMRFADGSGLSRKNYLSPAFIVGILKGMANSKRYSSYRSSLPKPGYANGTLQERMLKSEVETRERVWMKSGSMNGNRCFSGYIDSPDGKFQNTIVFSIMVNNFTGKDADLAACLDTLIATLAAENK